MADIKLSQLALVTSLADEDLILISQFISSGGEFGTYISKSITVANFRTEMNITPDASDTIPIGTVMTWTVPTVPVGYLECNGAAISRTTFADLFAVLLTDYGNGNGSTTFNIPDYRGEFLRGWAHGSTNDPDRASRTDKGNGVIADNVGTKQGFVMQSHNHFVREYSGHEGNISFSHINSATNANTGDRTGSTGGNETRPRNVNVQYIIKT